MNLKRSFSLLAAVALLGGGEAATVTWCGKGADDNWATVANWVGGRAPGGSDVALFPSGSNWTVTVSSSCNHAGINLPEGSGSVTIGGTGSLPTSNSGAYLTVAAGRELTVDGLEVSARNLTLQGEATLVSGATVNLKSGSSMNITDSAKLTIENGNFVTDNGCLYVKDTAQVILREGTFENTKGVTFSDNARYIQTGGSYIAHYCDYTAYQFVDPSTADIFGGTVRWIDQSGNSAYMDGREFYKLCPRRGGRIFCPSWATTAGSSVSATLGGSFAGEVMLSTNRTAVAKGGIDVPDSLGLTGGGDLYANYLSLAPNGNDASSEWNLRKICLGAGGIVHNAHSGVDCHFRDGTTFGAFADWSFFNGPDYTFYLNLHGPVVIDTLNCFGDTVTGGAVKTHTISGSHLKLADVTDLAIRGGGTVDIQPADSPAQMRTFEVAEGTTAIFTNSALRLKVLTLKLGEKSTIRMGLAKGSYIDVAGRAEIDGSLAERAKIVVTELPTLVAGHRYPIMMLPAVKGGLTESDFPRILFEPDLPSGWQLGFVSNCAVLSDGTGLAVSSGWSGAGGNANYQNAANWAGGTVPGDSEQKIGFNGTTNTVINNTVQQKAGNFIVGANAGPFAIRNKSLKFAYPSVGNGEGEYYSVRHDGAFPFVLECDVGSHAGDNSLGLRFEVFNEGAVAILGDSTETLPLAFGGDVRIGGSYTATKLYCAPNCGEDKVKRRSVLTVMPGAALDVTAQTGSQHDSRYFSKTNVTDFAYAVAAGGEMTVDGDDFTFTRAATHFVDGTLKVACPFVTTAQQTFRGDGTLALAQFGACTNGSVRLEGGLTLVPGRWPADLSLHVRDSVTIAPEADWPCAATNVVLDDHATLTIATDGHRVSFATNIVSSGEIVVTGAGPVRFGTGLTTLWKLSTPDGATIGVRTTGLRPGVSTDFLAVRRTGDTELKFAKNIRVTSRYDVDSDSTVYSARPQSGLVVIIR